MSLTPTPPSAKDHPGMQNITIERYAPWEAKDPDTGKGFSACIYGQDDRGQGWILWLDETGRPCVYYGDRDPDGAVKGPQVDLAPYPLGPAGPDA